MKATWKWRHVGAVLLAAGLCIAPRPGLAQTVMLHPGDALRLEIKNEPELSDEYIVSSAGTVMLPLVGAVEVGQRPFAEVLTELRARYAQELAEPDFIVTPLVRVLVSGQVAEPGLHLAEPTLGLAEVLALAGGPLPSAKRHQAELIRAGERIRLDASPGSAQLSMQPQSGDELHVPQRSWVGDNLPVLIGAAASVAAAAVTSLIVR